MTGAAILNVVEHTGALLSGEVRWLLVLAIGIYLFCIAGLIKTIQIPKNEQKMYKRGCIVVLICALVIVLLGLFNFPPILLLIIINFFILAPVFYTLKLWVKRMDRVFN